MKFLSIAKKDFKELIRDKRGLFMILAFPMLFMLVFGFAFGGMGPANQPYKLAVVNYDTGANMLGTGEQVNFGNNLTKLLGEIKYENSDMNIFNVTTTTENDADDKLKKQEVDALLILPENFSQSVMALMNSTILQMTTPVTLSTPSQANITSTLIIRGDTGYINFGVSQGILVGVLSQFQDKLVVDTENSIRGTPGKESSEFIQTKVEPIAGTANFTTFDFVAPGMIIFAILLLTTTVATGLTREVEKGTLSRLKLSKMNSFDLLFGGMLPWSLIAACQVIILLGVAIIIGFHWQGGINSIILAIIVGIIAGLASISLGMIIAAFARNDRQAANLGTIISVPTSFLIGAFFQLPQVVLFNIWGQPFQIYDILPWTHALNALRATLTFGGGWSDIAFQVSWAIILTIILFAIGVFLFSRNRLKAEK